MLYQFALDWRGPDGKATGADLHRTDPLSSTEPGEKLPRVLFFVWRVDIGRETTGGHSGVGAGTECQESVAARRRRWPPSRLPPKIDSPHEKHERRRRDSTLRQRARRGARITPMRRFLVALTFALAGCSTSSDGPEKDHSRPEDRFDVTRPGATFLDGSLVVVRMVVPGKDEPFNYYDAEIENKGATPLSIEVRTLWKDASDNALGAGAWQTIEIPAGQKKTVSDETEAYPNARYVKLEVRARP